AGSAAAPGVPDGNAASRPRIRVWRVDLMRLAPPQPGVPLADGVEPGTGPSAVLLSRGGRTAGRVLSRSPRSSDDRRHAAPGGCPELPVRLQPVQERSG